MLLIFGAVVIFGFGIGIGEMIGEAKKAPKLTAAMIERILRRHQDVDKEFFFAECAKEIENRLTKI